MAIKLPTKDIVIIAGGGSCGGDDPIGRCNSSLQ
jgi:hypothetical protein